jgi:quinoprotein glucose dehydrogenase
MEVPVSTINGEEAWPTQPIPVKPPPLTRQGITEVELTNISPSAKEHVLNSFKNYSKGPIYTPPSEVGTITSPGVFGGVEWHGGSFDPYYGIIYVNSNDAPTIAKLRKVFGPTRDGQASDLQIGHYVYLNNCSTCHGVNREGAPPTYPGLTNLTLETSEIESIIRNGKNLMPAFSQLDDQELTSLITYIQGNKVPVYPGANSSQDVRYALEGYVTFRDDQGYPAIAPPWGTLNAIDLNTGDFMWRIPLGEYPELIKQGIRNTGTLNYGGAVATAGGLVFIAATADEKFRAFEKTSGKLLWEYQLPAGGYATPSIYMKDGRQYVVIVAGGGGKNGTPSGDYVVAFALPQKVLDSRTAAIDKNLMDQEGWVSLFNGHSLEGWVHMNGSHTYTVENGAIIGRTTPNSQNSFLCSLQEFDNFELECEVMVDTITNQGIQFRSSARPISERDHHNWRAGRVWGPQLEIRQNMGDITTGVLYGEALGTGWLSSEEKRENGHDFYIPNGWNKIRLVANGPRITTYVNGHLVEDLINEEVYQTHPSGFIALQIHGIAGERQFTMGWRDIRVRPIRD